MANSTRRDFIKRTSIGAAATLAYSGVGKAYAANETIQLGTIGCGGRAQGSLMPKAIDCGGTRMIACCDIYKPRLAAAKKDYSSDGHTVFATDDYDALLAMKDIDAVIVGTPDHWHVPVSVAACKAGKDVYCEKPLTHSVEEGQSVIDAQNDNKRIFQVGTQQRSMPQFEKAYKLIRAGHIGDIHKVHMTWNRNFLPFKHRQPNIRPEDFDWKRFLGSAPEQAFEPYRAIGSWRWFWDFGAGILGDLMVHWLDAVHWIMDLDSPDRAVTAGDHVATEGIWDTPDSIQTVLQYKKQKLQIHFEGTFVNQFEKAGVWFMGSKGTLYADRGRYEITPEPRGGIEAEQHILGKNIKGADFDLDGTKRHIQNWLDCIKSRKKPIAPAEAGVAAANAAHFGNLSYIQNKVAER